VSLEEKCKIFKNRRDRYLPFLVSLGVVLVIFIPLDILGGFLYSGYVNDEELNRQEQTIDDLTRDLGTEIDLHLMILDSMDSLLRSGDPDQVMENHFSEFSSFLVGATKSVQATVILKANDEIIAYPGEFQQYVENWGTMVGSIPPVKEGIERMRESGEGEMIGPFVYRNGIPYLVAAKVIENGEGLWGFHALVLNISSIFQKYGLLDPDLDFRVQVINQSGVVFFGEEELAGPDLIERKIQVGDVEWLIRARPREACSKDTLVIVVMFIIGESIITLLAFAITYSIVFNQVRLGKLVNDRTRELEERSASLSKEVEKRSSSEKELEMANRELESSLQEMNSLFLLSRVHLEGHESLGEVYGRAVKVIEHHLLQDRDRCVCIRFDNKAYMVSCVPANRVLHSGRIMVNGKERGSIEIRTTKEDGGPGKEMLTKREKRIIGSIAGQLGTIGERWTAQQQEMEARNQAQFYLDLMSHDINNLHQGILMNLDMMRSKMVGPEISQGMIVTSMDLIKRSIKLVSNVKLLSYLKDLREPLGPVELNDVIVGSVKEVKDSFAGRELDIVVDMPGDQMIVIADTLVGEVMVNILNNGIKVQHEDPARIKIEVERYRDRIRVSVSDHGPGIRDSDKGRLFERHTGNKKERMMSGIGLSLVKVLMDRYGGRVWIEDRVKGRVQDGAKFVLEFRAPSS